MTTFKLPKIFYGWWIVSACFLISLLTTGSITLGFTAIFEPIADEFGWSYAQISLAASLRGLEAAFLSPLAGLLIDRWGPRRLMFAGNVLMGLGLFLISRTNSLGMFYAGFALIAIGNGGNNNTVMVTTLAQWFRKNLGLVVGILSSGFAFGSLLILLIVKMIDLIDWRMAILTLCMVAWVVVLPLSLTFRHKPEQYGYLPDGETNSIATKPESIEVDRAVETDFGTQQALTSRSFWHITLAMTLQLVVISTIVVHVMPYLSSVYIQRTTSSMVATLTPIVSITGRLSSGWLGDRIDKKVIAIVFMLTMLVGLVFLSYISSERMWLVIPYVVLFGIGWGGNFTLRASLTREYFGRRNYGSIFGIVECIAAIGAFIGPLLGGGIYDSTGSYHIAMLVLIGMLLTAVIILATTPKAKPHYTETR